MKKLLLLLITGIFPILTYSQEGFEYAITGPDDKDYFYKIVSGDDFGFWKDVWIKYEIASSKIKTKSGKYINKGGGKHMMLMQISCSSQNFQIKNTIEYDRNGKVINTESGAMRSNPIVPGSVAEGIYYKVCSK